MRVGVETKSEIVGTDRSKSVIVNEESRAGDT
jgi:hypothetical protein